MQRDLSQYTTWQVEMAITASLVELGLFSDNQMIAYAHWLLNHGYYNDDLLDIIDDDPLYPFPSNKQTSFGDATRKLGFPAVSSGQAKWIYSYVIINDHATRPNNYDILNFLNTSLYENFQQFLVVDSYLQDINHFENTIYRLDDALDNVAMGYVHKGYNDPSIILAMQREFFQLCEQWLGRNRAKIDAIFASLYD